MNGIAGREDQEDLAAWQEAVRSTAPGAATATLLEQRPELPATDDESENLAQCDVLLDSLIARQALVSHEAAQLQLDLDRLARQYPGLREHLATEVGLALGVAESTADKYLDDAGSIRRLPATFAALNAGQISAFKATIIRIHTENVSDEVARKVELRVLPSAGTQTVPELREACTRAVLRCDPAGAEERHEKAKVGRGMSRRHLPDGMALLFIESAAQDIATVFEACTALGAAARVKGDQRTADQRRMDALTDVCRDILDTGRWTPNQPIPASPTGDGENRSAGESGSADAAEPADTPGPAGAAEAVEPAAGPGSVDTAAADDASDPGAAADPTRFEVAVCPRPPVILPERGSRRPHILVTVPAATLAGGNQPGYLAGHGPITAGQARTIAADGDLTRLICDPTTGVLLDYGRTRYRPPDVLRDFVHTRDRTCVTPGCRAPAAHTDIDHITPYKPGQNLGGATDVDNLASLCKHHHRAKDGGGSRLRHHPRTGTWTWTTALGRTYTRPVVSLWEPADPAEDRALRKTEPPASTQPPANAGSPAPGDAPPPSAPASPPEKTPPPF